MISHAVIVTGDSDFYPVINAAMNEGVHMTIVHEAFAHDKLLDVADVGVVLPSYFRNWTEEMSSDKNLFRLPIEAKNLY